jgi:hypothetical protein
MVIGSDAPYAFYLPEDPDYTIVASALDSIRFVRHISDHDPDGKLVCASVDAAPDGGLVRYRGRLMEGTGYCADSVFGSRQLIRAGRALGCPQLEQMGWSYLEHVLATGFFDDPMVPVLLYRDVETETFLHNLEARTDYVELGHIARVAYQLLAITALDSDQDRIDRCRMAVERTCNWILAADRCDNGWYPRRATPEGAVYPYAPDAFGPVDLSTMATPDPIFDRSGAGVLATQLLVAATKSGLVDARAVVRTDVDTFIRAGGHFGSTNTDTEDLAENVSYALAFQTLLEAADLLEDDSVRTFAYRECLDPLAQFELARDYNGVATKGLLFMESSWNAACTWEMAEAAQAYLLAYEDRRNRPHLHKALTILRGLAKHHHGEWGFLTEAVDWDGHSTSTRHFEGEQYGDIATTHPFLNNLHHLQPTVHVVERFAYKVTVGEETALYDPEGNELCRYPLPYQDWMKS